MKKTYSGLIVLFLLISLINIASFYFIANYKIKKVEASFDGYKITPIIFKPSDKSVKPEYQAALDQGMAAVRDWYVAQTGLAFKYDPTTVVNSSHPLSYFICTTTPNCRQTDINKIDVDLVLADTDTALGSRTATTNRAIFMIGSGGIALGTIGSLANTYNYSFFGEVGLDSLAGFISPAEKNRTLGAMAHEFGHNFGLPHPDSNVPEWESLMGIGWANFPNIIVNNSVMSPDMNYLKKSPFLAKQAVAGCTPYTGGHLSITVNTVLCPGVYTAGGSSGGVISIDADNITFDGGNSTFWGNNTSSPNYGFIITGRSNVTVKNLRMSGYFYGLKVENSTGVTVIDSIFNKNRQTDGNFLGINIGFPGEGGGIVFRNVTSSTVENNILDLQNSGIHLYGSSGNTIKRNSAIFNKTWGVALNTSDNNQILYNDTRHVNRCIDGGCDSAGILLVQGSDDNLIEGNNMNYSGDGFFLGNGSAPLRQSNRNTIRNNLGNYSPNNGFESTFSTGNIFENNEANFNNYGFWLGYSDTNTVNKNIIYSNRSAGIEIDRGRAHTITNNIFKLNGVGLFTRNNGVLETTYPGTEVSNNYNINNNTFVANNLGLHLNNTQDSSVQNNNLTANGQNLRFSDKSKATVRMTATNNNISCFASGGGPSNLLLNKTASTNVVYNSGVTNPAEANDGDSTDPNKSFNIGDAHVGDWWKADIGSSQTVNAIVVYSWAGNYNDIPHRFHLEVSNSTNFAGEQQTVVIEPGWDLGNPSRPRFRIYSFPNVSARYVRFVSDTDQPWTHLQEIEAYNDPTIANTYSPDNVCTYNFYNELASSITTNLNNNFWEFSPKPDLPATIFDNQDDSTFGITQYSTQLSSRASVFGDSINPALSITQPSAGQTISGNFNFNVSATDSSGIRKVDYSIDGKQIGENYLSPFNLTFDTKKIANGSHTLTVNATDLFNNKSSVTRSININNSTTFDLTAPTQPTNLAANLPTGGSVVVLTWTESSDASSPISYLVKRNSTLIGVTVNNNFSDNLQSQSDKYSVIALDSNDNYSQTAGPVSINITSQKVGDINNDGNVNAQDLAILVNTWNSTTDLRADLNGDGRVASADLARLISNWGT